MEIRSGNAAESPGLCLCLLLFRTWTAGRVSSDKNSVLIASVPYLIGAFLCVLGLKYRSSPAFKSLWTKRRKVLLWEVRAASAESVLPSLSQTQLPWEC